MAKILVADDNSNIQKMVGLALKDQGIDVVAVGNGEAAVRKISDVRPDLVLADVFMPVRNGYEVCKYVKDDSKLSHIPVILLVGAFDPLDEQEAQRVGADGVLKKPFVPPDPLISMVKSALARAGVSYSGENSDKAAQPAALKASDLLTPRVPPPSPPAPKPVPAADETVPLIDSEPLPEEVSTRPAPLKIDAGKSAPVAFGNLLEPTPTEEDDSYITPVTSVIAPERNWGSSSDTADRFGRSKSWRRDGGDEDESEDTNATGAIRDWRETLEASAGRGQVNEWEASGSSTESIALTETPTTKQEAAAETSAAVAESAVIEKTETHKEPAVVSGSVISTAVDANANGIAVSSESVSLLEEKPAETEVAVAESSTSAVQESAPIKKTEELEEPVKSEAAQTEDKTSAAQPEPAPEPKSIANTWFTPAPNPWDAEIQKASQLASTWDTPAIPSTKFASADEERPLQTEPEATKPEIIEPLETTAALDTTEPSATAELNTAESAIIHEAETVTHEIAAHKEHRNEIEDEHKDVAPDVVAEVEESYSPIESSFEREYEKEETTSVIEFVSPSTTAFVHDPFTHDHTADAATELPSAAAETISEETAHTTTEENTAVHKEALQLSSAPEETKTDATPTIGPNGAEKPVAVTTADMDEVIAKVLAKMSPEVLQAVTREILKPVVEAIVRDELNKKS